MYREALDKLATIDRTAPMQVGSAEWRAHDAHADADAAPYDGVDDLSVVRARATRRVLTPAVERVLEWHQRRGA